MLKSTAMLLLGFASGVIYLVLGANYIGWNAVYGYGPKMIEWSLSMQATKSPLGSAIYFHDVLIFFLLAVVLSIFSVRMVSPKLISYFAVGVVLATLAGSFELLVPPVLTANWVSTLVIALIPLPVLIGIGKLHLQTVEDAA